MRQRPIRAALLAPFVLAALAACASGAGTTRFTNPNFDFGFLERVAVLPFENLTNDQQAGPRATRLMVTELLASGAVEVVEPGEVQAALDKLGGRVQQPSKEQVQALAAALGVQGLVVGSVTQSEVLRSGSVGVPVVSLDVHLIETETGTAVWAASHTEKGGGLGARVLGTGGQPIAETTRACVRRALATLVKG
jgi:TolB-like protein